MYSNERLEKIAFFFSLGNLMAKEAQGVEFLDPKAFGEAAFGVSPFTEESEAKRALRNLTRDIIAKRKGLYSPSKIELAARHAREAIIARNEKIEELGKILDLKKSEIKDLKKRIAELEAAHTALKEQHGALKEQHSALAGEYEALKRRYQKNDIDRLMTHYEKEIRPTQVAAPSTWSQIKRMLSGIRGETPGLEKRKLEAFAKAFAEAGPLAKGIAVGAPVAALGALGAGGYGAYKALKPKSKKEQVLEALGLA